jgi:UPF0271 protein
LTVRILILDTTAFIQGFDPQAPEMYTVPLVAEEVNDKYALIRIHNAVETGRLHVVEPTQQNREEIEFKAKEMGESHTLSRTDKDVLALGLQLSAEGLKPVIVSDDYSVQNMADYLGIKYLGLTTPGIKRRLTWSLYCPGCGRRFIEPLKEFTCPICGTKLKRKPIKMKKANHGDS